MPKSRRIATVALSLLACGALVGGTASAQTPGGYSASATAEALTIKIAGQTITTSGASAELSSAPRAAATATEVLLGPITPTVTPGAEHKAEATAVGQTSTDPQPGAKCMGNELTAVPGIRRFDITCGSASASITHDGGSARGLGAQVVLEPSVSGALAGLGLQDPAKGAAGQVYEQVLGPLVKAVTGTPIEQLVNSGTASVQDVLDKVLTLQATARITIAPALAEATAQGCTVTPVARAQGVRVELLPADGTSDTNNLLPGDLKAGEPLVTITIGQATVSKAASCGGGGSTGGEGGTEPKVEKQAALVTIAFGSGQVAKALGLPADPITIPVDQSFCVPGLVGTPLETCVTVAHAGVDAAGNPFADGTSLQLFKGVQGGIDIAVGRAAVGSAPAAPGGAATAAVPAAAPAPAGELPRTGGSATLPLVGGALLGLAVLSRRVLRRA